MSCPQQPINEDCHPELGQPNFTKRCKDASWQASGEESHTALSDSEQEIAKEAQAVPTCPPWPEDKDNYLEPVGAEFPQRSAQNTAGMTVTPFGVSWQRDAIASSRRTGLFPCRFCGGHSVGNSGGSRPKYVRLRRVMARSMLSSDCPREGRTIRSLRSAKSDGIPGHVYEIRLNQGGKADRCDGLSFRAAPGAGRPGDEKGEGSEIAMQYEHEEPTNENEAARDGSRRDRKHRVQDLRRSESECLPGSRVHRVNEPRSGLVEEMSQKPSKSDDSCEFWQGERYAVPRLRRCAHASEALRIRPPG